MKTKGRRQSKNIEFGQPKVGLATMSRPPTKGILGQLRGSASVYAKRLKKESANKRLTGKDRRRFEVSEIDVSPKDPKKLRAKSIRAARKTK